MFTTGRILFSVFFIVAFAIAMFFAYAKDKKHQKYYYKNVWIVAVGILLTIVIFATLTFWLHE